MSRRVTLHRSSLISVACASLVCGWAAFTGGPNSAFAQPAASKTSAPIAPKNAPSAAPSGSALAPPPPTPAPVETPATPPTPPADLAPPPNPPPGHTAAASPPPEWAAQWQAVFERGKAALAAGAFPLAARMLHDVAKGGPDPIMRAQALELARLASYWSQNRLMLMPASNTLPDGQKLPGVVEDKRSIDELAILYANTLLWGSGFGMVVGLASDSPDASSFYLPAIGMTALGAGALTVMDFKFGPLPYGVPQSITSGMYMGLEAGIYVAAILEGENAIDDEDKVFPGLIWGAATAGGLVGGLVGATVPVTPGRASFTGSGALWGGLLTSLVTIGFTGEDFDSTPFITGLIGGTAGGFAAGFLGPSLAPSIARVRFIDVGAVAGGLVFGGLYASIADRFDGQSLSLLTSAGVTAGLITSFYLTKDMDRDEPRRGIARKSAQWHTTPFVAPNPNGGMLGLAGRF